MNNIISQIIERLNEYEHQYILDWLEKEYKNLIALDVEIEECENVDGWDDQNQEPKTSNSQYITLDYGFFTAEGYGARDDDGEWFITDPEIKLKK